MLFYSAMGIAKQPVHLNASNYLQMHHRNWRTSLLVPFATNVAAVFYRCNLNGSLIKIMFSKSRWNNHRNLFLISAANPATLPSKLPST
jgi:hypothetical protein